jgi:hypothetical protein
MHHTFCRGEIRRRGEDARNSGKKYGVLDEEAHRDLASVPLSLYAHLIYLTPHTSSADVKAVG